MNLAMVVGTVVATQKNDHFVGSKLLICDVCSPDGTLSGSEVVAVDTVGAGAGDYVVVVSEGNSSRQAMRSADAPIDATIVGIVDRVDAAGRTMKVL
ncbi:MAG: EutN/CcmL family microcompartment protein [Clostridia bacterium]|nr:EutN/CcmL family microcompartment protein [Clostridia bacterium]